MQWCDIVKKDDDDDDVVATAMLMITIVNVDLVASIQFASLSFSRYYAARLNTTKLRQSYKVQLKNDDGEATQMHKRLPSIFKIGPKWCGTIYEMTNIFCFYTSPCAKPLSSLRCICRVFAAFKSVWILSEARQRLVHCSRLVFGFYWVSQKCAA